MREGGGQGIRQMSLERSGRDHITGGFVGPAKEHGLDPEARENQLKGGHVVVGAAL